MRMCAIIMKFKHCCIFFLYYLSFVVVTRADQVFPKNPLEEEILSVFDKWRKGSVHTNLFPLPSLKAININAIQSYYEGNGINVIFAIGDMQLTGLNNFSVESLDVIQKPDGLDIYAKLAMPMLTLHADEYQLHGRAYYVYPLNGLGAMTIVLKNVCFSLSLHFVNNNNLFTSIQDVSLRYTIGKLEADLENSSWPLSKVLNREGIKILDSYHKDINNALNHYVIPYVDNFLKNLTPKEFLNIIADMSLNSYVIN